MRINRLVCSTSRRPSSRHSVAISFGALNGRKKGRSIEGSSTAAMSQIMRMCGMTAVSIPHRSGHRASGPHDTTHLSDRACRIGDELQHQHREGPVEGVVLERQDAGIGLTGN